MTQYDMSAELRQFHDTHVKLDDEAVKRLAEVRDLNLQRIRDGLADEGRPLFKATRDQGGFAMKSVINDPDEESKHDIDVAVIFDADDLPAGALQARQRVRDALIKRGSAFYEDPEARTNAVTVTYSDGYHVDFAIYRRTAGALGGFTYEHASTDWMPRHPAEVTLWFNDAVDTLSPKADLLPGVAPKVGLHQLRRVVRLAKWFCRSRSSWGLPGGMITSTLVVECYRPNRDRDDVALLDTLRAIEARLQGNCRVFHPKGGGRELTGKAEYLRQVTLLKEKLTANLPKLDVLANIACTRAQARSAWDWIFCHKFWADKEVVTEAALVAKSAAGFAYTVQLGCDLAKRGERGPIIGPYRGTVLPKNMGLRFFVAATDVPPPYDVRFEAKNEGDEARADNQLGWVKTVSGYQPEYWTSTAYRGAHRMTCDIVKNGVTMASTSMAVKIRGGIWNGRRS